MMEDKKEDGVYPKDPRQETEEDTRRNDSSDMLTEFETEIGYSFNDISLLQESRTQSANKKNAFFGDAILDFIVSEFLFKNYTELERGQLTNLRSLLVCDEKLENIIKKNEWDDYLIIERCVFEKSKKMNSTFLEAVVGAIYLDGGLKPTETFVRQFIIDKKETDKSLKSLVSPKVKLYEFCQQHYKGFRPEPELILEEGPPHDKTFIMGFTLPKEITALKTTISCKGTGRTKADAEKEAADKINRRLKRIGLMDKE
ncbi:MAG: ribonuclease III domain-containing protein [Methanimicrococcus sp.]|nr:ribonuclease III domain-containing protein [Methanimicrococcus sp.]